MSRPPNHKSFQPKAGPDDPPLLGDTSSAGRNVERDWRGQKRCNKTHASTTDANTRLARKSDGQASIMAYTGHVPMENRSGLVAQSLTHATGTAERACGSGWSSLETRRPPRLGRRRPHDAHPGHVASQRVRKRIEEAFGWIKSSAGLRQTKHRGQERVGWCFALATTAYNLIRLPDCSPERRPDA